MGRKTYSFSALAMVAAATLSFSSADGAEAFAQETAIEAVTEDQTEQTAQDVAEVVPQAVTFTSEEVVQPLSEASEDGEYDAGSLRELVSQVGGEFELTEQMRCLAGAVYFESRGEPLYGQLAVAETVINRSEDRRWPASYCSVVYQPWQFSFVKNGRMPRINTGSAAWIRAKAIARIAHEELWESQAKDAVYFHANYVNPSWNRAKTKLVQIDTHIFYR